MPTLIIAEKPSQARDIKAALGTSFGSVVAAQGHLLRLEEPHEVDPNWTRWNNDLLLPSKGRYGLRADGGGGKAAALSTIKAALKTATECIIATDCDREGQVIGQELLDFFKFRGKVKRAIFTAQDPTSLLSSFSKLFDNATFQNLYDAGVARQQADQIFNLTLTRVASVNLKQDFNSKAIGIGRVKTPTLGIVCKREMEILSFVAKTYYGITMTVKGTAGEATLGHCPRDDDMILDKKRAEAIAKSASGYKGPIGVKLERKSRQPPKPMDLPSLQARMSGLYGWTATKTLENAQSLYENHKITTYPRAESRYLPETMIPDAPKLLSLLKAIPAYGAYPLKTPVIRKGKSGVWSDKALEGSSHHAIIPNINCPGSIASTVGKLNADESKLFDLIAKSFLAAIGEEWIYDQTTLTIDVATPPPTPCRFACIGSITISPGYQSILGGDSDDADVALPKFVDKDPVVAIKTDLQTKETQPPKRYNDGTLIKAMAEAWKFIDDPVERDRLKEAKGIGTAATRDSIITTLRTQNQIATVKKFIEPTEAGLQLYKMLLAACPVLLDPGATARMESLLDDVAAGKMKADKAIADIVEIARLQIPILISAGQRLKINNAKKAQIAKAPAGSVPKPSFGKPGVKPGTMSRAPGSARSAAKPGATSPATKVNGAAPSSKLTLSVPGTPLKVSFADKDAAKALGARFDGPSKCWYCPPGINTKPFQQKGWL